MESSTIEVKPVVPVAPYIGGKRNLARRLCSIIDGMPHTAYAEPFVGMGGVFLRRSRRPRCEVINDISEDVATFFRILQRHYVAFMDMLRFQLTTRAGFERLIRTDPATLTDLERAARFLYLQRAAFGGKVVGRNFGVTLDSGARFDVTKLGPMLEDLHERLAGVVVERLPFGDFISRYDRPGTLFYLDPPYWGCEEDYGSAFERADFERLAEQLARISGHFILSINDTPGAREVFGRFSIDEVETSYTIGTRSAGAKKVGELIVRGGNRC
ncbi:DNA adenine methylase [Sphingomonas ginkgonis]|uniref:site-specific DNA-methyltransferase (adenine-specific) n=1 Tax=Sphingomonas ginkgonis TaxID=2315330 RepID=A0A3R9X6R9_9SPHN|nr:DNA adenine methylase [Sphingomonas ginkgonis]RST30176.1 DNA adenine methylase [Sphingomonas ginkgonis]